MHRRELTPFVRISTLQHSSFPHFVVKITEIINSFNSLPEFDGLPEYPLSPTPSPPASYVDEITYPEASSIRGDVCLSVGISEFSGSKSSSLRRMKIGFGMESVWPCD